uniref:GTP-binding protein n=1 Tax=Rhizophora mucronata TaxID=61149 RepID=A0A2P2Q8L4_RHIMU
MYCRTLNLYHTSPGGAVAKSCNHASLFKLDVLCFGFVSKEELVS